MAAIDDFKANLIGGGARANQFRVTITPPSGIAIGLDVRRTSFLVTTAQLPSMELGVLDIDFRGRKISLAGDRDASGDWTVNVYNDTDFMIKNAIEKWSNGINDFAENTGVNTSALYMADLTVHQLDRDDQILKTYQFINAWPTTTGAAITLDMATRDAIEEFECTWRYQHFITSGAGLPDIVAGLEGD